jgi:hypothetical protein
MSQQGPIIVVSAGEPPPFASALHDAELSPVVPCSWADASRSLAQSAPAAVVVAASAAAEIGLEALARQIAATRLYLPLIVVDPTTSLPDNAIPCTQSGGKFDRLIARLRSALRVRTLHSTVMRRLDGGAAAHATFDDADPARDPTVLLIGRGAAYPSLSVSLGERMGVVGALRIEAAAKHLTTRDIDGIVLGEGFTPRVEDAFLTVLAEDARFRNLPVVLTSDAVSPTYDLPNLEIIAAEPSRVAANALPLLRQHAFEAHLRRMLKSIDAGGLLDPRTGLLAPAAFNRDFATAVHQTVSNGGGLSVARFAFDPDHPRAQLDGARILSRLMRQMDFGAAQEDGSVIVVFAETDLRTAHMIARRLTSVIRQTSHGKRDPRSEPLVTVASLLPSDSAKSLMARLYDEARRAAS